MKMVSAQEIIQKRNNGILVDMDNMRSVLSNKYLLMDSYVWHAFVIHSRHPMARNQILQMIFDLIYPLDFVPLNFETLGTGNDYIFFARDCSEAIQRLCANNLLVPNSDDRRSPLRCEIILQYASLGEIRLNIPERLKSVLHLLYTHVTRTLNLDNFCENEGLSDYFPLSQPKILYHVLNAAAGLNPLVIKLRNNEIHSLSSQEVLWKCTSLTHLDLRNNQDGILVSRDGAPAFRKNFLCNDEGFALVNKFMETYFSLYDKDRKSLEELYHPKALCSITNVYKTGQITSNDAKLRPYQINCRNLLAIADLSRSQQYLIKGNQFIIRKLIDLPQVEHDPFSFSTDLIFYSEDIAVINVCGVFREIPDSILDSKRGLGFNRTFVLRSYNGEYLITNDMLHVYNALSIQVSKAFSILRPITNCQLPPAKSFKDKEKAVETFEVLSGLTNEWSTRFLEKANYNIIECIKSFMGMYKVDKIPPDAFKH